MVALNENFAFENPHSVEKNRVGDFFVNGAKTRQVNRLSAQQPRLEKAHGYDETASGMFFYGFRYYDAETGRWLSKDPIEESGGLNLYGMVGNNPISRWDYLGMTPEGQRLAAERQRILKGLPGVREQYPLAADLLRHYLQGSGESKEILGSNRRAIMNSAAFSRAVEVNLKRIEEWIDDDVVSKVKEGECNFSNWWDRVTEVSFFDRDQDVLAALQGFTVTSYVYLDVNNQGGEVSIKGEVEHLVNDYYDFNANTKTPIPSLGFIQANDLIEMHSSGIAQEFWAFSWMNQSLTASGNTGFFFGGTDSINFGEINVGRGKNLASDKVISEFPNAERMKGTPKPRGFKFKP